MFSFRNLAVEMGHFTFLSSYFGIILCGSALNKLIAIYIYKRKEKVKERYTPAIECYEVEY